MKYLFTIGTALFLLSGCADMVTGLAGGSIPISLPPTTRIPAEIKVRGELLLQDSMYNTERDMTHCYYGDSAWQVVSLEGNVTCPEIQRI